MANHVTSFISFHNLNAEAEARLEEMYKGMEDGDTNHSFDAHRIFGISNDQLDEMESSYNWYIENIGAKWCYIEDPDMDSFRTESAWSVPWDLFNYVMTELEKVQPHVFASVTYEDEMPNFVGWATWHHGSFDEGREWEWDEIQTWILDNHPNIAELYDREADEWKDGKEDEGRDLLWDVQWDFMEDVRDESLREETTWYFNHEEEIIADYEEEEVE